MCLARAARRIMAGFVRNIEHITSEAPAGFPVFLKTTREHSPKTRLESRTWIIMVYLHDRPRFEQRLRSPARSFGCLFVRSFANTHFLPRKTMIPQWRITLWRGEGRYLIEPTIILGCHNANNWWYAGCWCLSLERFVQERVWPWELQGGQAVPRITAQVKNMVMRQLQTLSRPWYCTSILPQSRSWDPVFWRPLLGFDARLYANCKEFAMCCIGNSFDAQNKVWSRQQKQNRVPRPIPLNLHV